MRFLLVALGASAGAPLRSSSTAGHASTPLLERFSAPSIVNVAGAFLLGILSGWTGRPAWAMPLLGMGFCGALTTFSTLTFETWVFFEERKWGPFAANLGLSLGLGVSRWSSGYALTSSL